MQLPLAAAPSFPAVLHRLEADVAALTDGKSSFELPVIGDMARSQTVQTLGITGFGLSVTSLEEVFLRLNNASDEDANDDSSSALKVENQGQSPSKGDRLSEHNAQTCSDEVVEAGDDAVTVQQQASEQNEDSAELANDQAKLRKATVNIWNIQPDGRSCTRQWRTMIYKRWINFKRDIKGIISQVLLPIVFVALVMLTLTADISPVGSFLHIFCFYIYAGVSRV